MHHEIFVHKEAMHDAPQGQDFFAYKRSMADKMTKFIDQGWFTDQKEMKSFTYNEQQENPDGIIMEVNTANVGWPGMIEIIDAADIACMKQFPENPYAQLIKQLNNKAYYGNTPQYFEKYILSELQNKNAEKIILIFSKDNEIKCGPEGIGLKKEYAQYISLKTFKKIIKDHKAQLEKVLLMNYGLSANYRPRQNYNKFQELFQDRYINQENSIFSSKEWPVVFWREALTGAYTNKEKINEAYPDILQNDWARKSFEQSFVVKKLFTDQGMWIYFPGEWNFTQENAIKVKAGSNKIIDDYVLQRFHELPRKISIEKWGEMVAKSVDIRAYATLDPQTELLDIQVFGREGDIGKVNNVSSGGKFTKVYILADEEYYAMQSQIHETIVGLSPAENNRIEKYFDDYAQENIKIKPDARISYIPFILSVSWAKRIWKLASTLVDNMIKEWCISRNESDQIIGTTVIGIDMSINPLPQK